MKSRMPQPNRQWNSSLGAVALAAILFGSSLTAGTAVAQSMDRGVQQCSCSLLKGVWAGYGGTKQNSCDACDAGYEPTCGCEQPSCGCEPSCDGGCDGGCSGKSGCGLLSNSADMFSKFKLKLGTMLKPKGNDCQCCRQNAPCASSCGCGDKPQSHHNTAIYQHNMPEMMPVPPAPMIVAPVEPSSDVEHSPHYHYEEPSLPAPKADSANDPFRDDSVRVRRTPVPAKHAPVTHLQPIGDRKSAPPALRPAVFEQSAMGDRWSAPLHVARLQSK
ncbi:hypothetical protein EC9_17820 [Rosistilla ulvae]|uniref:TNFR-Cys domain-containing protein n=1 Tax=Rosistilla ulvae TaxID=1930277 RepID=A0A517LYB6_9BACT|nr:hypothetical protein [Rosistilla ulvae]QDS87603.1 hypothetical protein EC9_17820 [Rosistilla ulvae]